MATEPNEKDLKLIQYLNEAYGKERELETALQAHIAMAASRPPYKKRLQQHLKETKNHAKQVQRRIKQLGGKAEAVDAPGPVAGAAAAVQTTANKAVAAAQGPLHALRGTGEEEKLLKNVKTEYFNEAEEIATYTSIQVLAEAVGDRETAKLARGILREEERMQKFLGGQISSLTKAVARAEIPAAQRRTSSSRKRSSSSGGSRRRSSRSRAKR
jgi:ferritin-like metal-binding protein YciE